MTSQRSSVIKPRILSAFVLLLAALTVLIAFAAPAQQDRSDEASPKSSAEPQQTQPSAPARTLRPVAPGSLERFAGSPFQAKIHNASVMNPENFLSFLPAVAYNSNGTEPTSVAVGDLNGDGNADLVAANLYVCPPPFCLTGNVAVLLGNGDGTFQTAVTYGSGGAQTLSVAIADVNGDGRPDLVVANHCLSVGDCLTGTVGVLLGNGDGTFQAAVAYDPGGYGPNSVAVADVNGDGKLDIVVADSLCVSLGSGCVGVLMGNGDGTFQAAVTQGSGPEYGHSIAVGDVNGDGKFDLLVGSICISSPYNCADLAGVMLGNGDGTFQTAVTYNSGEVYQSSVAVADLNGDGKLDLLVANLDASTVGVLLGNGDGTFQTVVTYNSGGATFAYPQSVAAADVDGDGKLDLLVVNEVDQSGLQGCVGILLGNGDGTLRPAVAYDSGGSGGSSLAVADVNRDGRPDLLVSNFSGSVGVLLNNTLLQSATSTTLTSSQNPSTHGQPITFTATVTTTGPVAPTGTVNFKWGPDGIGQGTLNASGVATSTTSILKPGPYKITAVYKGDASNLTSTSTVLHQGVKH